MTPPVSRTMSVQTARARALRTGALLVLPALLYAPVLYYSLHSPFSLTDDYVHWRDLHIFESPSSFFAWLQWVVGVGEEVPRPNPTRVGSWYRPVWQLYNAVVWTWFGTNAPAHHLIRWILHFGAVAFFCAAFCRICAMTSGRSPRSAIGYLLPLFLMLHVWLFFPNSPATRLSNSEVLTAFFLGLCNYVAAVALSWESQGGVRPRWRKARWRWLYGLFFLGFLCLTFAKEVNFALSIGLLVGYLVFVCLMRKAGWRGALSAVPLAAIVAVMIKGVYAAMEDTGVGYGHAWSAHTSMANAAKMLLGLFQVHTSAVVAVVFVALLVALAFGRVAGTLRTLLPALQAHRKGRKPGVHGGASAVDCELAFVLFLAVQFVCMFAILAASWGVTLRYWYPLVPLLSMLLAFAAKFLTEAAGGRPGWSERRVALPLAVFVVFYVACNYYNFAFQTVAWHSLSNADAEVIEEVRRLGDQGEHVVVEDAAPACSLIHRVGEFLAFYRGVDFRVHTTPPENGPYYYVTQKELPEQRKATTIRGRREYGFLAAASSVAGVLQLRREPFSKLDRGVWRKGRPYVWNIYHIPASDSGSRTVWPTPPKPCLPRS